MMGMENLKSVQIDRNLTPHVNKYRKFSNTGTAVQGVQAKFRGGWWMS